MKSKYLVYKNGKIVSKLNEECEQLLYDYFLDSHSGLVEWVAETLNNLLKIFIDVDYNENCESLPFVPYKPNLQIENLHPQMLIFKIEEVFRKNHNSKEIQSVLKCFDFIVEEIINSIKAETTEELLKELDTLPDLDVEHDKAFNREVAKGLKKEKRLKEKEQ